MLIQGGCIMLLNGNQGGIVRRDIRVQDTNILEVEDHLTPLPGEKTMSAEGMLVLPGLVNAHYHSYTNLLKGTSPGEPLELWSLGTVVLGAALTGEEMALSAQLGMVEMLRCGVTSCVDHIPHLPYVENIAAAYHNAGFRVGLAPMIHNVSDHRYLAGVWDQLSSEQQKALESPMFYSTEDYRTFYESCVHKWHSPEEHMQVIVGPNAPQRATLELLEAAGALAKKHGLSIHSHLLESRWQRDSMDSNGEDGIKKLAEAGLLGERTALAHSVWLNEDQLDQVAQAGCTVVHNPTSNLFLGSGIAPFAAWRERRIPMALGSDGSNCATGQNMLEIARIAALIHRCGESDPARWPQPELLWNSLTETGSRVTGWSGQVGAIQPGQRADLIACPMGGTAYLPLVDVPSQLLMGLSSLNPEHVVIDGQLVMEKGRLLTLDEECLREELLQRGPSLRKKYKKALAATQKLHQAYQKAYALRRDNC